MPYVKNWLHCAWATRSRVSFLTGEKKYDIITHIRTNAGSKGIYIDHLDGSGEHLHCLLLLRPDQSLAVTMKMIRGESSFWINRKRMFPQELEWSDEYFGVSVSESAVAEIRNYIRNQEEHHRFKTWQEECEEFLRDHGFSKFTG